MKKLFENLYQIFLIATNEPFLFNFFHILKKKKKKKNCCSISETPLSTSHILLFIECLRYII